MLVHRLLAKGQPRVRAGRRRLWPGDPATPSGEIDRPALGRIVFADPQALRRLEAITHPAVDDLVQQEIASSTADVIVVDAVKLLESGLSKRCNAVWVVTATPEQQLERLTQQRGMSKRDARQRLRAQSSQAEKVRQADVVIDNSGTLEDTEAQVRRAWAAHPAPVRRPTDNGSAGG